MTLRILIAGQKWFGAEVFASLSRLRGVEVVAVCSPVTSGGCDRLTMVAMTRGLPVIASGTLNADTVPDNLDLIVAAHSHDFIGERTRLRARFGGIGYHPSLLPLHRGKDAIRWAIRMRDRVTGGTVYRLSNHVDGGDILAQSHAFIRPEDTAELLWRRDLAPLGVRLLTDIVRQFADTGYVAGTPQDEELSTWEPSIDRPPVRRPDLLLLPDKLVAHCS